VQRRECSARGEANAVLPLRVQDVELVFGVLLLSHDYRAQLQSTKLQFILEEEEQAL
jgi:hypothetical protein